MLKENLSFVLETIRYSPAMSRIRHRGLKISHFVPPVRSCSAEGIQSRQEFFSEPSLDFHGKCSNLVTSFRPEHRRQPLFPFVIFAYSLPYPINSRKRTARISCSISHIYFTLILSGSRVCFFDCDMIHLALCTDCFI